jgi:hypothetical protein
MTDDREFESAPGNPGFCTEAKVDFSNAQRKWTEVFNLVDLLEYTFEKHGVDAKGEDRTLYHASSGFRIFPQLVGIELFDDGGVRTVTTTQIHHALVPVKGIFEYQHSTGDSVSQSVAQGFNDWLQSDFVTLLDCLRARPEHCTLMEMTLPGESGQPDRLRRAVLGPVAHCVQKPIETVQDANLEEHPFCPCCLLTNSFAAFNELFMDEGFHAVRLLAMRDEQGAAHADCRVNGLDYERGAEALRQYVKSWLPAGFEFRKQYVVIHTRPSS